MGTELLIEYGAVLEDRYTVKVDQRAIDALF
jgi:hypothetical protein